MLAKSRAGVRLQGQRVGLGVVVVIGAALIGMAFVSWVNESYVPKRFGAPLYASFFTFSGTRLGEGKFCVGAGAVLIVLAAIAWFRPWVIGLAAIPAGVAAAAIGVAINSWPSRAITAWPWISFTLALAAGAATGLAASRRRRALLTLIGLAVVAIAFVVGNHFHHALGLKPVRPYCPPEFCHITPEPPRGT